MLPYRFPTRSARLLKSLTKQTVKQADATLLFPAAWVLRGQGAAVAQLPFRMRHLGRFKGVVHFQSEMSV